MPLISIVKWACFSSTDGGAMQNVVTLFGAVNMPECKHSAIAGGLWRWPMKQIVAVLGIIWICNTKSFGKIATRHVLALFLSLSLPCSRSVPAAQPQVDAHQNRLKSHNAKWKKKKKEWRTRKNSHLVAFNNDLKKKRGKKRKEQI